jgi:hypothetical protein
MHRRMGGRHYSDLMVVGLIGVVGTFTVLYAVEFVFQHNAWCIDAEEHCVRGWIGALSGWAAAFAAAVTGYFIYGQMKEARQQTAFQVGNAAPTMDAALDLDEPRVLIVRLLNWNRRGILVLKPQISGSTPGQWGINGMKLDGHSVPPSHARNFLRGWEDRAKAPHSLQYKIISVLDGETQKWSRDTSISVLIHMYDEKPLRIELRAQLYPDSLVVPD